MNGRPGGFVHQQVLLEPVLRFLGQRGARVSREHPVRVQGQAGYVDAFIEAGATRLVCEAELTLRRIPNDLAKAAALQADLLLVLVPTWALARRGRRLVRRLAPPRAIEIWILPVTAARQRLAQRFPMMTPLFVPLSFNHETAARSAAQPLVPERSR